MGSGCFTLSHYYEGISEDFKICEHLDIFRDMDELKWKINYYLTHEVERKRIAENRYIHVQKNFSADKMAQDILTIYRKYAKTKSIPKLVHAPGSKAAV